MLRGRTFPILFLLLAAFLVVGDGKGVAEAAPGDGAPGASSATGIDAQIAPTTADEVSRLCPDGAIAFVRLSGIKKLQSEIVDIGKAAGASPADLAQFSIPGLIGNMMGNKDLEGIDLGRTIGIALFMGPGGQPAPMMILPITDQATFQAALERSASWQYMKDQVGIAYVGKWAVWAPDKSMVEGIKLRDEPVPVALSTVAGDVSMKLDMATLYKMLGPQLDQAMGGSTPPPGAFPAGMGEMVGKMQQAAKEFLAGSQSIELALTLNGGDLSFDMHYAPKAGSSTAKALAATPPPPPSLLRRIAGDGLMSMEFSLDGQKLWDFLGPFYEKMLPPSAKDVLAMMKQSFTLMKGGAVSLAFANGIDGVSVTRVTDGAAYEKLMADYIPKMQEMMKGSMPPEMAEAGKLFKIENLPDWEYGGMKIHGYQMTLDFTGMGAPAEESKKMVDFLLGGPALEMRFAVIGNLAVQTFGASAKTRMAQWIDQSQSKKKGALPPAFARATEGFPENPNALMYVNFADIAKMVGNLPLEEMPDSARALLQSPPADLSMCGYYAVQEGGVDASLRISLGALIRYGMALAHAK